MFSEGPAALVSNPLAIGIVLGLIIGKQVGITLFSWGAVRAGLASPPSSVTWRQIYGVAWLGGIGFTMSLFIGGLAFGSSHLMDISKIGIYVGSLVAGLGGVLVLWRAAPARHREKPQRRPVLSAVCEARLACHWQVETETVFGQFAHRGLRDVRTLLGTMVETQNQSNTLWQKF